MGLENPKPWDATLPPPELKVPIGFCSPKEAVPNPKLLAPLFPKRVDVSAMGKGGRNLKRGSSFPARIFKKKNPKKTYKAVLDLRQLV